MKTYPTLLIAFAILFCSCAATKNNTKLQYSDVIKPQIDLLEGEHNCTVSLFQGIFVEDKIYISWIASSDYDGFYFIIEKSYDNKTYKPAMIKTGTSSPKEFNLLYCATDTNVAPAKTKQIFYRIRVIKQYEFSEKILVSRDKQKIINAPVIAVSAKTKSGNYSLLNKPKNRTKGDRLAAKN